MQQQQQQQERMFATMEAVCPNDIIRHIITAFASMACSTPPPACLLTSNTVI
jgi:hypothetical protein